MTEAINGDLLAQESRLYITFGIDAIVNATGLASGKVANDNKMYHLRGALVRVHNDGPHFPKVKAALSISANVMSGHERSGKPENNHEAKDNGIVFLAPCNDKTLITSGIAQKNEWNLDSTLDSPSIQRMRERCEALLLGLKNAVVDSEYPLAQGLRPAREGNVRVEREFRMVPTKLRTFSRILHSYNHGGSGWSLSFGCAVDVCELVEEVLQGLRPQTMVERWEGKNKAKQLIAESS